jgi:hypothetical protein
MSVLALAVVRILSMASGGYSSNSGPNILAPNSLRSTGLSVIVVSTEYVRQTWGNIVCIWMSNSMRGPESGQKISRPTAIASLKVRKKTKAMNGFLNAYQQDQPIP